MGARRKSAKRQRPSRAARSSRGNGARAPLGARVPKRLRALGGVDPRLLAAGVPYPCDDPRVGTTVPGGRTTPGGRVVACAARGSDRRGHDLYVGGVALTPRQIAAARRYAEGEARRAERRASRAATATAPRGRRRAPAKEIPPFVYDPHGPLPSAALGPGGAEPRRPLGYGAGAPETPRPRVPPAAGDTDAAYLPAGAAPTFADRVETFAQFVRDDFNALPQRAPKAPTTPWSVDVRPAREFWYVTLRTGGYNPLVYEVGVRDGAIYRSNKSGSRVYRAQVSGPPSKGAPEVGATLDNFTEFWWGGNWPYASRPVYVGPRGAVAWRESPLRAKTPETRKAPSDKPSGLRTAPPLTGTWVPRALARTAPGSGADEWKDITELAKMVRADIRAAQDNGALPKGLEVSVTTERYSMGRSLNVTVTSVDVPVMNTRLLSERDSFGAQERDEAQGRWVPYSRFNNAGRTILANLDAIVRRYHVDKSDMSTDYYNVNFSWSGAGFASWVEHQQQQSLFPADAPERPEVFVDYYLTHALGEALGRMKVKLRWGLEAWAFTNGQASLIAVAPTKHLAPVNLPVPDLAGAPANEYAAGDLGEAFELALSLAKSPRKNPRSNPGTRGGPRRRRGR